MKVISYVCWSARVRLAPGCCMPTSPLHTSSTKAYHDSPPLKHHLLKAMGTVSGLWFEEILSVRAVMEMCSSCPSEIHPPEDGYCSVHPRTRIPLGFDVWHAHITPAFSTYALDKKCEKSCWGTELEQPTQNTSRTLIPHQQPYISLT